MDERLDRLVAGGQYRVLRRIGAGGFGVVYEAETLVGGLRRALKVLSRRWAEDPDVRERFVNEALVLEEVNHPHVARCYAAGRLEDDGDLYLLFELIEGVQLARMIASAGRLEPMRAVRLAKQIAAGLEAAHKAGVLHRDLKPENILVTEAGTPREQVKVVDFGIAKLTEQGLTSTQTIVGTPEFMAPEQFLPGSRLDFRVDLWQLGATLFAMLTGRPPYRVEGAGGVAAIIAQQRRRTDLGPAPSEVVEELRAHRALDLLVSRLLASDLDRRPTSAAEVCEELARIEHGLSPDAARSGSEALLGALAATPSESGWLALHGYLSSQTERREALVALADRMLEPWPDELRRAPCALWEASKRGEPHALWPIVRSLDLSARGLGDDDVRRLAGNPALGTITRLDLSHNEIGNEGLEALAASPHLSALVHLDLSHNRVTSGGLEALARTDRCARLRSLRLAQNGIGARGAQALAESSLRLAELDLSGNDLGSGGAAALADAESLADLTFLGLAQNRVGPDGIAALAVSKHLRSLRTLDLSHDGIGPSGAAALALSGNLRSLRALRLGQNGLGREGLQLLLSSTAFGDLGELDLSGNGLGASGAMLLAGSPFVRRLERLELSDDGLGDAGVAALLGSPHLAGLRYLGLAQNGVGPSGASLLADAPPQLEELDLSNNPIGETGSRAVADALARLRITRLAVRGCGLPGDGVARILDAGRLASLDASHNPIGVLGAEAIAASAGATSLEHLDLSHAELGGEGVAALVRSANLLGLRRLVLDSNGLGDFGVTALVASAPRLARPETLSLEDDDLGPDAAEAIAASPLAGHLRTLRLAHNELGDSGAEALARGPTWHALRSLDLQRNGLSLAGAAAVTSSDRMAMVQRINVSDNALTGTVDMHSLGQDTIAMLESSFAKVQGMGADFAERFYEELFARYPTVKPLFARTSMARQQGHLLSSLVLVIDNLRSPDSIEKHLKDMGRRHFGYGVVPTQYYAVTSTLLDTLRDCMGDEWTPELGQAWEEGLAAVANVMLSGGRPAATKPATVREKPGA